MENNTYRDIQGRIRPDEGLLERTREAMREEAGRRRRIRRSLGIGAAACAAVLAVGIVLPKLADWKEPPQLMSAQTEPSTKDAGTEQPDDIHIHELTGEIGAALDRKTVLPEDSQARKLTLDGVLAYLGRDVRPASLPAGLNEEDGNYQLFTAPDGNIVFDEFSFSYRELSAEAYDPLEKRFDLTVSKREITDDCVVLLPEQLESSRISGTEIILGHRLMEYGPYDELTHAPAGTFDCFAAEFQIDGIACKVVAENFSQEEFLSALRSMIK